MRCLVSLILLLYLACSSNKTVENLTRSIIVEDVSAFVPDNVSLETKSPADDFVNVSFMKGKQTFLTVYLGNGASFPSKECDGQVIEDLQVAYLRKTIDCKNNTKEFLIVGSLGRDWPRQIHASLLSINPEDVKLSYSIIDSIK